MSEGERKISFMGFYGAEINTELDAIHEAYNSEDLSYVARRGFAVNAGDRLLPDVQFPFITISGDRTAIRVRNQMKDVFRGVQLHLSETESQYAEITLAQPNDVVDAIIRYADDAELAPYSGLVHTGPMPVYAMCMKDEQLRPIVSELEKRMTAIREEEKKLAEEPIGP